MLAVSVEFPSAAAVMVLWTPIETFTPAAMVRMDSPRARQARIGLEVVPSGSHITSQRRPRGTREDEDASGRVLRVPDSDQGGPVGDLAVEIGDLDAVFPFPRAS
jgi:hypothetical protein